MHSHTLSHLFNPPLPSRLRSRWISLFMIGLMLALQYIAYAQSEYWFLLNGPGTDKDIRVFATNSLGHLYVGASSGRIWKTTDDGITWVQTDTLPGNVLGMSVNAQDHLFASVIYAGVYRSTDGGASWEAKSSGLTSFAVRMNLVDRSGIVWVASEGGMFASTNNGDTWVLKKSGSYGVALMDSTGAVITYDYTSLYRTTNTGATWETVPNPSGFGLLGVHPGGAYYYGGFPCALARSTNRGATWTVLTTPFDGLTAPEGAKVAFNSLGHVFMSMGNGGIALSSNNGATWKVVSSGLPQSGLIQLFEHPTGYLYAGLSGSGLYRTRYSTLTATGGVKITARAADSTLIGAGNRVLLYDSAGTKIGETTTDTSSTATFGVVPSGSKYSLRVYYHRATDVFPWGDSYWGSMNGIAILADSVIRVTFYANTPRIVSWKILVDSTNTDLPAGGAKTIMPGTRLRVEVVVKNPVQASAPASVFASVRLDRDQSAPYDLDVQAAAQTLAAGEARTCSLYCTPTALGGYSSTISVASQLSEGSPVVTDGVVWRTSAFLVDAPSPWRYVVTGTSHTIIFPLSGYYTIRNARLRFGDYVGVFYDSSGTPACAGYERWTGTGNLAVTAFGDDPTTPAKDGMGAGEVFKWKICRPDSGTVYDADAIYTPVGGVITSTNAFTVNGVSGIEALTDPGVSQCPVLRAGWSLISSNVAPYMTSLDSIFQPVLSDVIILKNGAQQSYIPSVPLNTIGQWNSLEGYQLKMKNARTLCFNGQRILPQAQYIPITAGWSIIPYYRDSVMSIAAAFASFVADVVIVKDQDGHTYLPSAGVNTIGTLKPGQGYQIKLSAPHTLLYPAADVRPGIATGDEPAMSLKKSNSAPAWSRTNTGVSHTIIVPLNSSPRIGATPLVAGDYIGVFYDSSGVQTCAGYEMWTGTSNIAIAAFGDDPTTAAKDGFAGGEALRWKIWRQSDAHTFIALPTYVSPGSLGGVVSDSSTYSANGISAIASLTGTLTGVEADGAPTVFSLRQNYPNPFNPSTTIGYTLGRNSMVELTVLNALGQEVARLVAEYQDAGLHTVKFDAGRLASGIYFYRLRAGEFVATRRLTLIR